MVDNAGWGVIYKLFLKGRKLWGYGDFKQLKAVDGNVYNSPTFLNYIFNKQENITTNYRNNFTRDYYDKLIEGKKQDFLIKEMKQYRCKKYEEGETIICYRNKTKDKYNALMCKKNKIKNITDIGAEIISITNDLKENGIYNKFQYKITDHTIIDSKKIIVITDGVDIINIPEEGFEKYFNFSYARTLYSVQGETLKSFFYPDEDLYFLDGRTTYTLISRLKFKLDKEQTLKNEEYVRTHKGIPLVDRSCKICKIACCCRCKNPSYEFCNLSKRNWCNGCRGWKCSCE